MTAKWTAVGNEVRDEHGNVVGTPADFGLPAPTPKTTLAAKLAAIMLDLESVPKRGYNDFHKYAYATEADITEAVRGKLAAAGIAVNIATTGEPKMHGDLMLVPMRMSFIDSSGEIFTSDWWGAGSDKGDKALYKAYTGALKYWLLKNLLLPTGDDPEADSKTDERAAASEATSGKDAAPPRSSACPKCASKILPTKYDDAKARGETHYCTNKGCGWKGKP